MYNRHWIKLKSNKFNYVRYRMYGSRPCPSVQDEHRKAIFLTACLLPHPTQKQNVHSVSMGKCDTFPNGPLYYVLYQQFLIIRCNNNYELVLIEHLERQPYQNITLYLSICIFLTTVGQSKLIISISTEFNIYGHVNENIFCCMSDIYGSALPQYFWLVVCKYPQIQYILKQNTIYASCNNRYFYAYTFPSNNDGQIRLHHSCAHCGLIINAVSKHSH